MRCLVPFFHGSWFVQMRFFAVSCSLFGFRVRVDTILMTGRCHPSSPSCLLRQELENGRFGRTATKLSLTLSKASHAVGGTATVGCGRVSAMPVQWAQSTIRGSTPTNGYGVSLRDALLAAARLRREAL